MKTCKKGAGQLVKVPSTLMVLASFNTEIPTSRVVDPDPEWIRIQQLCGYGSGSQYGSGSVSRGKLIKIFHLKNARFSYFYKKKNTKKV
jgi:hypothetical protein